MLAIGDRIVQIPIEWPSRKGTVKACDDVLDRTLIVWDDGRSEWISEEDFVAQCLWLINHE